MTPKRNILIVLLALTVPLVAQVTSYLYVQTDQNGVVQLPSNFHAANATAQSNALRDSFVPTAGAPSIGTTPGASRYYGTDGGGVKGWIPFPSIGAGDMGKSTYDTDNDGTVDSAEAVAWAAITSKPNTFPPDSHAHAAGDITSGVLAPARLGSGTANSSTFLRGDNSWQSIPGGVAEAPTDGSTYGRGSSTWTALGNSATRNVGTAAGQVAAGDDTRFLTSGEKTDLLDGGDSGAHYHSADRARANHTGTQARSTISDFAHASTHQSGQGDALTGNLDATARVTVRKNSGADIGSRRRVNLSEGSGVTLTIADDPANEEVDVVVSATAGGGTNTATLDQSNTFTGATNTFQTVKAQALDVVDPVAIAEGGTAATSAGAARTNLGLAIGSNVQAYDADLDDLADGSLTGSKVGTGIAAGNITTGTIGTARLGSGTANSSSFLRGDSTWAVPPGGGDAVLANSQTWTGATNTFSGTVAVQTLNVATQNVDVLNLGTNVVPIENGGTAATSASAARTSLGLAIGSNVQAYDADLDDLADGSLTGSKIGSGIDAANITTGTLPDARLDADLQDLADGSLSGSKVGSGIDGNNVTVNTVGTGPLVRQSAAGGTFAFDVDTSTDTADGNSFNWVTIPAPNNSTVSTEITVTAAGPSSHHGMWKLSGIVANYSGSGAGSGYQRWTNYTTDGMNASLAQSGTNLVLSVRGPTNSAQNIHWIAKGLLYTTTNAAVAGGGGGSAMTNGVVAHWEMSGTGSTAETDVMGANDLTVSAGDTIPSRTGVVGNGRDWADADDDYMSIADNDEISMSSTASFTVSAWVLFDTVGVSHPIAIKTNEYTLTLQNTDSTIRWTVANATTNKQVVGPVVGAGTNYFIAATYNYTNGIVGLLVCSPTFTNYTTATYDQGSQNGTSPLYIGSSPSNTSLNHDGFIDEVTIFKRAITTNQALQLNNVGVGVAWPWSGL